MSPNMRIHFDQELAELQEQVLVLGSRAGEAVARGVQALMDGDTELAREVIANDLAINDLRYAIEKSCYAMLAQEQPVAGDMRRIVAALTMVNDLERIGDHGKRIATICLRMAGTPRPFPFGDVARLSELALTLLDRAMRSLSSHDVAEARAVCVDDDPVDALYGQMFNVALSHMLENTRAIAAGTYLIQVAHELERVGDRATNIAERLIYATTGELVDLNT
jgi:phosphate transport system protein